ncbi:MAG: S41 family peptidase, partial [Bacteroidota bacterium]
SIKCGHTELYFSNKYLANRPLKKYPIEVLLNNKKIIVSKSETAKIPIGSELISINGIIVAEIISQLKPFISSDGTHDNGRNYWLSQNFFNLFDEMLSSETGICIEYVLENKVTQATLLPTFGSKEKSIRPLLSLTFSKEEEQLIAKLKINTFDQVALKKQKIYFKKFLHKAFREINTKQVKKLIIDLRDNTGGTDLNAIELYSYITSKSFKFYETLSIRKGSKRSLGFPHALFFPVKKHDNHQNLLYTGHKGLNFISPKKIAYNGKLEILINGGTMSAASHFVAKCHNNFRATIIGNTTSGLYTHSNSGFHIYKKLPNTGLQLFIPAIKYELYLPNKFSPQSGISPHIFKPDIPLVKRQKVN